MRQAERFESWEQIRTLASFSITHPIFKAPNDFNQAFKNPYAKRVKGEGRKFTNEEVRKRLERWDKLNYKQHPMYNGR